MAREIILVADQAQTQRQLIDMLLAQDGYEIVSVGTGRAALEYLREHTPSVALLDIELKDLGGAQICEKMKKVSRLATVPVVLTAPSGDVLDERTRALASFVRADLLLQKPLGDKNLRQRIRALLDSRAETSEAVPPALKTTQFLDETLVALDRLTVDREPEPVDVTPDDESELVATLRRENETLSQRIEKLQDEVRELRARLESDAEDEVVEEVVEEVDPDDEELPTEQRLERQAREIEELKRRNQALLEALEEIKAKGSERRGLFGGRRG